MTIQTLKLGRDRFVLLREKDYRELKAKAERNVSAAPTAQARLPRKARHLTSQDRGDIAEAKRRRSDPNDKPVSWDKAKKELGLA
jgi:hypothetical protein